MVPFSPLINNIFTNKNINYINGIDKKIYMKTILENILYISIKMYEKYQQKYPVKARKFFKSYNFFVFSLLLQIEYEIFSFGIKKRCERINKIESICSLTYSILDDEKDTINSYIFGKIINVSKEKFIEGINEAKDYIVTSLYRAYSKLKNPLLIKSTFQQLFRKIMKNLFIYNRYWSKKKIFFNQDDLNIGEKTIGKLKLKYKQLSNYTKSFQQPLLYPILEFNEYIPSFSQFNAQKLFKHQINDTVNYDFIFKSDILTEMIKNNNPLNKHENRVKCCLIKKTYHVKGEIIVINRKKSNSQFEIIFCSDPDLTDITCNKNENKNVSDNKSKIINSKNLKI